MYTILQWTPFPGKYEPIPLYQLQEAERKLCPDSLYYHQFAVRVGNDYRNSLFYYPYEAAEKIVTYWQEKLPFARFLIIGGMTVRNPTVESN